MFISLFLIFIDKRRQQPQLLFNNLNHHTKMASSKTIVVTREKKHTKKKDVFSVAISLLRNIETFEGICADGQPTTSELWCVRMNYDCNGSIKLVSIKNTELSIVVLDGCQKCKLMHQTPTGISCDTYRIKNDGNLESKSLKHELGSPDIERPEPQFTLQTHPLPHITKICGNGEIMLYNTAAFDRFFEKYDGNGDS